MKQKIYISGKITGLPLLDMVRKFEQAEEYLTGCGWDVINPLKLDHTANELKYWEVFMKTDLKAMLHIDCNNIYVLPCWQDSPGAKMEVWLAIQLSYNIIWA